jgi:hypothetical protein
MRITVNVPDSVYHHIQRLGEATGRSAAEIITAMMSISLSPLDSSGDLSVIRDLDNAEVLALAESQMNATQNTRMSELLAKQQAGELIGADEDELAVLLYVYQEGSIRKAQALAEAKRRGILEMA